MRRYIVWYRALRQSFAVYVVICTWHSFCFCVRYMYTAPSTARSVLPLVTLCFKRLGYFLSCALGLLWATLGLSLASLVFAGDLSKREPQWLTSTAIKIEHSLDQNGSLNLVISSASGMACDVIELRRPPRLVIDCPLRSFPAAFQQIKSQLTGKSSLIKSIRFGRFKPEVTRIVFDLTSTLTVTKTLSESDGTSRLSLGLSLASVGKTGVNVTPRLAEASRAGSATESNSRMENSVDLLQSDSLPRLDGINSRSVSLADFLAQVRGENLALGSKRLDIDSASANVESMRMPNLSPYFSYSVGSYYRAVPYQPFISPQSNTYSLSATIEAPGKREAREIFATGEVGRHRQELSSLERNIEFEAALSYVDALRSKALWQIYDQSIARLSKRSDQKSKDALKEDINNRRTAVRDMQYQSLGLYAYLGKTGGELIEPIGSLKVDPRQFELSQIIQQALNGRADLQALNVTLESANNNLEMVKKNRRLDLGVGFSISDTPGYTSSGTSYNKTSTQGFSLSIPIPFQQLSDADVRQAANTRTQIELNIRDLKVKIRSDVAQSHLRYTAATEQLANSVKELAEARSNLKATDVDSLTMLRDKEIALLDADTAHTKALINLLKATGNYVIPAL